MYIVNANLEKWKNEPTMLLKLKGGFSTDPIQNPIATHREAMSQICSPTDAGTT